MASKRIWRKMAYQKMPFIQLRRVLIRGKGLTQIMSPSSDNNLLCPRLVENMLKSH